MQLIVLGMHRSGTSSITRLLNLAGAYFGPEGIATDPNAENPKGFWERRDVRAVCDELLHGGDFDWWKVGDFDIERIPADLREQWVEEFRRIVFHLDAHRPWVMKEPRLCLLLPVLRPVLEAPVFIHVTRDPLEIAESLLTRNDFPVSFGLALWEAYTVQALRNSVTDPSVIVSYGDLVTDPVSTTTRLIEQLGELDVQGLRVPTEREITAFITPDLHRQRREPRDRVEYLNEHQAELVAALDANDLLRAQSGAKLSAGSVAELRTFEGNHARLTALEADHAALEADHAALEADHAALEADHAALEADHAALEESRERSVRELEEAAVALERSHQAREAELRAELRAQVDRALRRSRDSQAAEEQLKSQLAGRRRAEHQSSDAIASVARRVRILRGSGAVRLGSRVASVRDVLRLHRGPGVDVAFTSIVADLYKARAALQFDDSSGLPAIDKRPDEPPPIETIQRRRREARARGDRTKVAVLAWDVGHNPLGRAHLLADLLRDRFDVELWGAQFDRYGSHVWLPHRDTTIPIHRYAGASFPAFLETMQRIAGSIEADALYVSKPRFPSFGVGILAKEAWNRPLIVDVDDFEPAFFQEVDGLEPRALASSVGDPDLELPFGRLWTRTAESVVRSADALTVSNPELEARYGGVIVPHARDETVFDPARYERSAARRRLGIGDEDRVVLFGGTPRAHKGIIQLLEAAERLGDKRVRVAVFGTRELDELRSEIGSLVSWILPLPNPSFDELPIVLAAADIACALQSPDHPVSRYQMPAKVTDAMAMGVPCLVTPVPPLQSLIDKDVLEVFDGVVALDERLGQIFEHFDEARDRAYRARELFLDAYSYDAIRPVLAEAIERHLDNPPPMAAPLSEIIGTARDLFGVTRPDGWGDASDRVSTPLHSRRPVPPGSQYDLVVFWKQNDTGVYGRRQDMFLKYLERSGRFHTIVHFDEPMSVEGLWKTARRGVGSKDQNRLVAQQTLRRVARRSDRGSVRQRTFLYASSRYSRAARLPRRSEYVDYVKSVLEREGVGDRPLVAWVYPTSNFFPEVADALLPDLVVADVVDDNRTWYTPGTPAFERIEQNYAKVLARSDVVLANCEPVAGSMETFTERVHVVPNACELPGELPIGARPAELRDVRGPIIGYAGNLSGRIDLELLRQLARARRDWTFVLLGSTHLDRSALALESEPNVRLIGTKRYEEAQNIISHFDVALIPHVDNEMSRSMNPLKAYVYCALGVPIVSTPVANLDELAEFITVANGKDEFLTAIETSLRNGRRTPDRAALVPHSWERRVADVLGLIDRAFDERRANAAAAVDTASPTASARRS